MMPTATSTYAWPPSPYKGFSYYTRNDVPLFAGRDEDILRCAHFLTNHSTRFMILYGSTGCGKSSFLRAGLLPFLESGESGFCFLKSHNDEKQRAVFVRSTDAPLCRLSESLYEFASQPLQVHSPLGIEHISLSSALDDVSNCTVFANIVGTSSEQMLLMLRKLEKLVPQTLVIVIDQAEEVLTLKPGPDGQDQRDRFFDFLMRFRKAKFDIKLLIAIRREWVAPFENEIQKRTNELLTIPRFQLNELTEPQIIEAIERPTSKEPFEKYGCPYDQYGFSYQEGLPRRIAQDLLAAHPRGGILPIMQIVCDRLYGVMDDKRKSGAEAIISAEDYSKLGGIEGQIEAYVSELLTVFCARNGISREKNVKEEIKHWKYVLYLLTQEQPDGTATTQIKSVEELRAKADEQFCELDFDKTMEYLSNEEQRVLRREVITNLAKNQRVVCYSLGHDAIGLALYKWKVAQGENQILSNRIVQTLIKGSRYFALVFGSFFTLVGIVCFVLLVSLPGIWLWDAVRGGDASGRQTTIMDALLAVLSLLGGVLFYFLMGWGFFRISGFMPKIRQVLGVIRRKWRRKPLFQ